ncbi:hypothetical protein FY528_17025 [Hymenobacter lutimineralis]|uniref:Uncharacterized protein n=1 Tax=Hymenobacter lutimineralis TaxID=2606448 RepID=A0A5D6UWL2_9BACT|nr:hypothetical protein [Hymenobacter lutimineralis]TYZ06764.1 hypothetical protein FY528_17025 [Hymenobacter lutimineralis]
MRTLLLVLPALLLAACSGPASEQTSSTTSPNPTEPLDTTRAPSISAQADTLKVVRHRHDFSSPGHPDLFMLALRGTDLTTGEATFTITAADGTTIFREVLQAADLEASLVYSMTGPTASKAEREAFIRKRMDEFFADKQFGKPAAAATEAAPADTDQAAWEDLRKRPDAVYFRYLVGKEEQRRIAWSSLRKQVVRLPSTGG